MEALEGPSPEALDCLLDFADLAPPTRCLGLLEGGPPPRHECPEFSLDTDMKPPWVRGRLVARMPWLEEVWKATGCEYECIPLDNLVKYE